MSFVLIGLIALSVVLAFGPWFQGYRTYLSGFLTALWSGLLPIAHEYLPLALDASTYLKGLDWTQYVAKDKAPFIVLGVTLLFMVLKFVSQKPWVKK